MKTRRSFFFVFFFILLWVVVLLQINSFVQLSRFSELLGRVEDAFESGADRPAYQSVDYTGPGGEELPGDEGDWLIWAFHVEPKTLNQISAEGDIYSRWITVPYIPWWNINQGQNIIRGYSLHGKVICRQKIYMP